MAQLALIRIRFRPASWTSELGWWAGQALSAYAALTLPECGAVIALSGCGLNVGRVVRDRGGVYVCDRGSSHIRWQNDVVGKEYAELGLEWAGVNRRTIRTEEQEYAFADVVTVPSSFAKRTFVEMGVPTEKVRVIPYGVNLGEFRRTGEKSRSFRILFVGQLSVRKGLHYLLQAFRLAALPGAELILVGSKAPETDRLLARFPVVNMTWKGAVPRDEVVREMSLASVMVLPSIEEGLALVQGQALACGCPVIATTNTGAEDLFEDGKEGFIIAPRDVDLLSTKLIELYENSDLRGAMSHAATERVKSIGGWQRYGDTVLTVIDELLTHKK